MTAQEFKQEMRRMASTNGVPLSREDAIVAAVRQREDESLVNVFSSTLIRRRQLLIVTSVASYHLQRGAFSVKTRWSVPHRDLVEVRPFRISEGTGYVVDGVELELAEGRFRFETGFNEPTQATEVQREIAAGNAQVAAEEIAMAAVRDREGSEPPLQPASSERFAFDPKGPEEAGEEADAAYGRQEWTQALALFFRAVDRLHDFYVVDEFRSRQPSPADAWMVQGVVKSLGVIREVDPTADLDAAVVESLHRLSAICVAIENAGGNATLYRRAIDDVGRILD